MSVVDNMKGMEEQKAPKMIKAGEVTLDIKTFEEARLKPLRQSIGSAGMGDHKVDMSLSLPGGHVCFEVGPDIYMYSLEDMLVALWDQVGHKYEKKED